MGMVACKSGGAVFGSLLYHALSLLCHGPRYVQKQQALLGQMLAEGYGCPKDAAAGKEWADKARRRGYRMAGVYCEL